jgi:hypothetical protein
MRRIFRMANADALVTTYARRVPILQAIKTKGEKYRRRAPG